jgi:uncharacterized protein YcbX
MATVSTLYSHPIKGIGRQKLEEVRLTAGQTMPEDRIWAVTHEASKYDPATRAWASCNNFIRGAKAPELQAIELATTARGYRLWHNARQTSFEFDPGDAARHEGFLRWLAGFIPENRAQPKALVRAGARGMTDSDFPSIAILTTASLQALSDVAGQPVEAARFRGNIWLEGCAPWEERGWIGKRLRIGEAEIEVREHIGRCMATTVNPDSGKQDVWTLKLLEQHWGHTQFGVYGEVVKSGRIAQGDKAELI